ncbi:DUF2931 family protein [Marinobacter goseongensis]|uniref:DUF2931 family protein n=1 Tax=Marinobacter goseongensis TaxID=453838 RepID=UPI0020044F2B|nr:DUF2931 family protein [Marinobacter goseongensis]MCK7551486.1 DUF2931 family protein [Marinobacter goseongensis]
MRLAYLLTLFFVYIVSAQGCASPLFYEEDDFRLVTVGAPKHYNIWVLDMFLEKSGERSWRQPIGSVGCCWQGAYGPSGKGSLAQPFPELIWIHWFSLAEQKYYAHMIHVPKDLSVRMREKAPQVTNYDTRLVPRHTMTIGLAPGGTIVMWILNQAGNEIEVMRIQAKPIEGDPSRFQERTKAYMDEHGDYLKTHGLQLDKW